MFEKLEIKKNTYSRAAVLATIATIVTLLVCAYGEGISGSFGSNQSCYKYLGCSVGFFGYDALEHFLSGIALTWILVWIFQKFPKYSLLSDKLWKNVLILIALVALFSVLWELSELVHDVFRSSILHQPLINFRLNINLMDQPTNLDTMGDLFFELFGSVIALIFAKL
jgi:hypothetical protein